MEESGNDQPGKRSVMYRPQKNHTYKRGNKIGNFGTNAARLSNSY